MSAQHTVCALCGKPLDQHFLVLYDSTAHAGVYGPDGSQRLCTRLYAEIDYQHGRAQTLFSIARSLKNLAGRMRHAGNPGGADRVRRYAEARVREGEAARQRAIRWYQMWTKADDR
jgi:hypothetical protein